MLGNVRAALSLVLMAIVSLAHADEAERVRVVLIGDSTVKNGRGRGDDGLWGWGQVLEEHFDPARIDVENRALGGRSSRTYWTEGLWERSLERLRPGDFLLMQFGHNDGGDLFEGDRPRASIKGNGDETLEGTVERTGKHELVHSYGWYLREYIAGAKGRGATPIVLSPVPRDRWENGRVIRSDRDYGRWAREAAEQGGALFIDLNELVARRYEELGAGKVGSDLFTERDWTHTTQEGARVNAACVVEGIRGLRDCPLKDYLIPSQDTAESERAGWLFDFGDADLAVGYRRVLPTSLYSKATNFGLEPGEPVACVEQRYSDPLAQDALGSRETIYFSVALPEGNYRVHVWGGPRPLTVKAELRRLMVEQRAAEANSPAYAEFTVNIRRPFLPGGGQVRLKARERTTEAWAWDEKLTLEFSGDQPSVSAIRITPEPDAVTVFLAGDSTVADQPREPWNSWGQMLPRFFQPGVAVANHAESGESIRSSLGAGRFDKIFSLIRSGDYLFLQFGHNDMKDPASDALTSYRDNLAKLVRRCRDLGAQPVLVTSMERKLAVQQDSLGPYPQAVRDVATEHDVPMIDLNAMSRQLYLALGDELDHAFQDGTHHTSYGSYLLAKCVAQGIRDQQWPLAGWIVDDFAGFDPASPDSFDSFKLPPSPARD